MAEIPKYYLPFIEKACDIDGNGKLENGAEKDGQKYDEVSIFNQACKSYDEKENTVIINGVVKKIQELVFGNIDKFLEKFKNYNDMSQPSYFDEDLTRKNWAKKRLESDMKDRTVRRNMAKFEPYFEEAANTYEVPKNVLKAICMKESTMGKGSNNVMQINPITAKELKISNVNNPRMCIMKAAELLKSRLDMADGNLAKALVGYNVGYNKPAFTNWTAIYKGGYADKVLSFALAFDELDKQNNVA